jgi:hypothetical protein
MDAQDNNYGDVNFLSNLLKYPPYVDQMPKNDFNEFKKNLYKKILLNNNAGFIFSASLLAASYFLGIPYTIFGSILVTILGLAITATRLADLDIDAEQKKYHEKYLKDKQVYFSKLADIVVYRALKQVQKKNNKKIKIIEDGLSIALLQRAKNLFTNFTINIHKTKIATKDELVQNSEELYLKLIDWFNTLIENDCDQDMYRDIKSVVDQFDAFTVEKLKLFNETKKNDLMDSFKNFESSMEVAEKVETRLKDIETDLKIKGKNHV